MKCISNISFDELNYFQFIPYFRSCLLPIHALCKLLDLSLWSNSIFGAVAKRLAPFVIMIPNTN